jgi:membrane associated rhomboid family serine protease
MFPLRDNQKTYKTPFVTYVIIGVNVVVFLVELTKAGTEAFIYKYALVSAAVDFANVSTLTPFITSQFLHAGFIHILSNMWFLKIFGDNVEERFGSVFFLFVYLMSGVVGGLLQYLFATTSEIPMLGASGAVAGVLGAYLVFFPKHQIETLIPFGFFSRVVNLPASFMLFYWFVTQLFAGVGSVAISQVGGVAWWAHIGGFGAGWIIAKFISGRKKSGDVTFEGYEWVN